MKKIAIALMGENGRMGQKVKEAIIKDERFKLYKNEPDEKIVMIDFSDKDALENNLNICLKNNWPLVICTTAHEEKNLAMINKASKDLPILFAQNTSLGANLLLELVSRTLKVLKKDKITIEETHHRSKKDSPSGTALMLQKVVQKAKILSYRKDEVIGEHKVKFYNENEELEISHRVLDRQVFAIGALNAALFLSCQEKGLYSMADVLKI